MKAEGKKRQFTSCSLAATVNSTESQIQGQRLVFNTGQIGDLAFINAFDMQPPRVHLKRACLTVGMGKGHWLQPEGLMLTQHFQCHRIRERIVLSQFHVVL